MGYHDVGGESIYVYMNGAQEADLRVMFQDTVWNIEEEVYDFWIRESLSEMTELLEWFLAEVDIQDCRQEG